MSKNDDYTTGNVLDFSYHQNYYKLIGIDLSTQTNISIPEQIYFPGKLEWDEKAAKNYSKPFVRFINCSRIT